LIYSENRFEVKFLTKSYFSDSNSRNIQKILYNSNLIAWYNMYVMFFCLFFSYPKEIKKDQKVDNVFSCIFSSIFTF